MAPSLWSALADTKGRRITYICTLLVFLVACIWLAETRTYTQLLILRCLQSTGSASTVAIGAGVVSDITTRAERGGFIGIYQAGLLAPVTVGPIIGGALTSAFGWRAVFWFLAIYCAIFLVFLILLLPETLRTLVGNGGSKSINEFWVKCPLIFYQRWNNLEPESILDSDIETTSISDSQQPKKLLQPVSSHSISILEPLHIICSLDVTLGITFMAIYFATWQMSIVALSVLFQSTYGLTTTEVGLIYIVNGMGTIIGTLVTGKLLDRDYRRMKDDHHHNNNNAIIVQSSVHDTDNNGDNDNENNGGVGKNKFSITKARLRLTYLWGIMQCLSLTIFGWSIDRNLHISIPIITTFFSGWRALGIAGTVMTFVVDVRPDRSASAGASINLARCFMAAVGTACVMPLIAVVGAGWCFSLLVGVMTVSMGLVWGQGRINQRRGL